MRKQHVKTIDLLQEGTLLPPAKDLCQQCATKHLEHEPHNKGSLFYQMWFKKHHGRWPTWKDATDHMSEEGKKLVIEFLKEKGVPYDK